MKRESREWIKIAEEDLRSAECLFTFSLYRMVCYHAQQAVEKILKATLTEHEAEVSRIHNILDLCNAIEKIGHKAPLVAEEAIFLNSIYRARYPSDLGLLPSGEPTREDADNALSIAKNVKNWLKNIEREHC